jgi:hypothetical protein
VDDFDELPATPWRWRALILLLAVSTAITIVLALIYQPGRQPRPAPPPPPDALPCKPGQTSGCVGGKADITLVPAAASSPR